MYIYICMKIYVHSYVHCCTHTQQYVYIHRLTCIYITEVEEKAASGSVPAPRGLMQGRDVVRLGVPPVDTCIYIHIHTCIYI